MSHSGFSFGVVVTPKGGGLAWTELVRRLEAQGYTSVLVPDTLWTPSPLPALAAAAAVTTTVKVRTWVLAAPFRSPAAVARETSALQELSDGRFELGIGPGRPDAEAESARLDMPWGSAAQRRRQVAEVARTVRDEVDPAPEVIVAAGGPRMLADAAGYADRISLAAPPTATEEDLASLVDTVHAAAGRDVPRAHQLVGIGDRLPRWITANLGLDAAGLIDAKAAAMLHGDVAEMASTLRARRQRLGIREVIVPGELADAFAPVLEHLV